METVYGKQYTAELLLLHTAEFSCTQVSLYQEHLNDLFKLLEILVLDLVPIELWDIASGTST